jgi:hypothetical protein
MDVGFLQMIGDKKYWARETLEEKKRDGQINQLRQKQNKLRGS